MDSQKGKLVFKSRPFGYKMKVMVLVTPVIGFPITMFFITLPLIQFSPSHQLLFYGTYFGFLITSLIIVPLCAFYAISYSLPFLKIYKYGISVRIPVKFTNILNKRYIPFKKINDVKLIGEWEKRLRINIANEEPIFIHIDYVGHIEDAYKELSKRLNTWKNRI